MNKKILHVVNSFGIGGMENGLVNIINHCNFYPLKHIICSFTDETILKKRIKGWNHVKIISLNSKKNDRLIFMKMMKVLQNEQPNVVHIRNFGPLLDTIIAYYLSKINSSIVLSLHGLTYEEHVKINFIKKTIRKFCTNIPDCIITLNGVMKNEFEKIYKLPPNSIRVIGNGVDTNKFKPIKDFNKIADLKENYSIPKNMFILGSVGRLDKIKNHEFLIDAFSEFSKDKADVSLIIIGDGEEKRKLIQKIKHDKIGEKVIFLGHKNNLNHLYSIMDVYVQTSLYEGFSNTIIEAMACGIPIICSDVGGNKNLIKNRKTGYLFNSGDIGTLIDMLNHLYSNPDIRKKFSSNSRLIAENKWPIELMVKHYSDIYSSL